MSNSKCFTLVDYSLDMDDFHRVVQKLGNEPASESMSGTVPQVKISVSPDMGRTNQSPSNLVTQAALSASRMAQCGSPRKEKYEVNTWGMAELNWIENILLLYFFT